jgi:hypothetical protein
MRIALATMLCFAVLVDVARGYRVDRMRMPVVDAVIHSAECPHIPTGGSCAIGAEVWVSPRASRFTFAHELGHAFDAQALDARARDWLTTRLGFPVGTAWETPSAALGPVDPSERFADAYAHCALGTRPRDIIGYGYLPGRKRHRRICNAIAILGLVYQSAEPPQSTR